MLIKTRRTIEGSFTCGTFMHVSRLTFRVTVTTVTSIRTVMALLDLFVAFVTKFTIVTTFLKSCYTGNGIIMIFSIVVDM